MYAGFYIYFFHYQGKTAVQKACGKTLIIVYDFVFNMYLMVSFHDKAALFVVTYSMRDNQMKSKMKIQKSPIAYS